VTTVPELARSRAALEGADLTHVLRLIATWRPLADLSFSDLLLFAPIAGEEDHRFVVLGMVRPVTGQTAYPADLVGTVVDEVERPLLSRCWRTGEVVEGDTTEVAGKDRVHVQCTPVRHAGKLVAILTREAPVTFSRRRGELERVYFRVFERFSKMIAEGSFPFAREEAEIETAPRVGDGVIVVDGEARVQFASPNAVSSLHRMGIHAYAQGQPLGGIGFDDTATLSAMRQRLPVSEEVEQGDVSILLRALPLLEHGNSVGALLLIRDVTDLRRRDRMLMSKDATIREIHHRVKNNLQTIASLLRLQGRRLHTPEARGALAESERRIRSIAIVHETLSRDAGDVVHFADIVRPLVRVVEETVSSADLTIRFSVEGDAGDLPGEVATPLAVILNELMQNAVDHAFPRAEDDEEEGASDDGDGDGEPARVGHVRLELARDDGEVTIDVVDDGVGLPERFSLDGSKGLGLSIVQALVTGELEGSIEIRDIEGGGAAVHLRVPVAQPRVEL
jgi:two-component sensor histidine kinase